MSDLRSRPEPADPLQMSVAEKLACEWEARHDVAARGRINHTAPVQHYLTHVRCEDNRHSHPAAHKVHATSPETRQRDVALGLRGWWRSLRDS